MERQMSIHFNTRQAAVAHLATNGWKQIKNGNFVSRDSSCAAKILTAFGEVVLVQIWEVGL